MKKHRGMTLIELILVIAVGAVLVLGIVLFTRQQTINGVQLRDFTIAYNLGRLKMAQMNLTAYASIPVGTFDYPNEPSFPGYKVRRITSTVTETTIAGKGLVGVRQIDMRVDRSSGNFSKPLVKLITYRQSHVTRI